MKRMGCILWLICFLLGFTVNTSAKQLFYCSWDGTINADTGPVAKPWHIARLSKEEFKKGTGCLDLVQRDEKEKTGILFDGVEINSEQGSIESYFKTKWTAQKGTPDTMFFDIRGQDISIWVSCDGRNLIIDFANPVGKEKRLYANIEKVWAANEWHQFVLTWQIIPGENNDIIEAFVDGISCGRREDLELWSGTNRGIVKTKLAIGLNTSGNFGGNLNSYVDEFSIYDTVLKPLPTKEVLEKLKEPIAKAERKKAGIMDTNLVNIAPFAELRSNPYVGYQIKLLVDGLIGSYGDDGTLVGDAVLFSPKPGMNLPIQFEFIFPKPVPVERVRLYQYLSGWAGYAKEYIIEGDSDGDGIYEKVLFTEKDGKPEQWLDNSFPPTEIKALRFRPTKGEKGSNGCRYYPVLGEFEIYADKKFAKEFSRDIKEKDIYPILEVSEEVIQSSENHGKPKPWNKSFLKGLYLTWPTLWRIYEGPNKVKQSTYFQNVVGSLKKLGVNHIVLYSHTRSTEKDRVSIPDQKYEKYYEAGAANIIYIWPSKVARGTKENILKEISEAFEEYNIGIIPNVWPVPFGKGSWSFPRVQELDKFPCIISSAFFKEASTELYSEITRNKAGGIVLGGDEYFVSSHPLPVPPDDPCIAEFKKYYNYPSPPEKVEDTEKYRKWVLFQYEQLARLFKEWNRTMKSINPEAIGTTLFYADTWNCSERIGFGICDDIIGDISGIDTMGTDPYWSHNSPMGHYYSAEMTKRLTAATKKRSSIIVPQIQAFLYIDGEERYVQYSSPLMVYGPAVSALMHGAKGIAFYRGDYAINLQTGELTTGGKAVKDVFSLMSRLEEKGFEFDKSYIPRKVALLYSRASEDWWGLAHSGKDISKPPNGWTYHRAVMEVLFRKGYPFEMYYLDQPEGLKEIGNFKVIILPFVYSISKEAVKIIEDAIAKGTRVIVIKNKGETDEYGNPYSEPLLKRLIQEGKIDYLDCNLNNLSYSEFAEKLTKILDKNLGKDKPLYFENYGYDVETTLWETKNGDKLVWMLNWEEKPVEIEIGINLPPDKYKITQIDFSGERQGKINGQLEIDSKFLKRFHCPLLPHEFKVLYITNA